jgi:SH3-like domain-containing protein
MSAPAPEADVVAKLTKNEEVVFLGEFQEGYVLIQGADAEGWVREILISE